MLSRKYYKEFASILKKNFEWAGDNEAMNEGIGNVAMDLCTFFATENPRFKSEKFLIAAGMKQDE